MKPSKTAPAGGWAAAIVITSLTAQCSAQSRVEAVNNMERQNRSQAIAAVNTTLESVVQSSDRKTKGARSKEREALREAIRALRADAQVWESEANSKNPAQHWQEIGKMHGRAASVAFLAAAMHAKETESVTLRGTEPGEQSDAGDQAQIRNTNDRSENDRAGSANARTGHPNQCNAQNLGGHRGYSGPDAKTNQAKQAGCRRGHRGNDQATDEGNKRAPETGPRGKPQADRTRVTSAGATEPASREDGHRDIWIMCDDRDNGDRGKGAARTPAMEAGERTKTAQPRRRAAARVGDKR